MDRDEFLELLKVDVGTTYSVDEYARATQLALSAYSRVKPVREKAVVATQKECHKVTDANQITTADASSTATAVTLLNDIKAKHNTHIASSTYHRAADTTNSVSALDATDLSSGLTLATELITDMSAHQIQDGVHMVDDWDNAPLELSPVDETTLYTVANKLKSCHNTHLGAITDGRTIYVGHLVAAPFIEFEAIEYPVNCDSFPQFNHLGSWLEMDPGVDISLSGERVLVWMHKEHQLVTFTTVANSDVHIVALGAQAYAMLRRAISEYDLAANDLTLARSAAGTVTLTLINTALGKVTTSITAAEVPLGKVTTYLESNANGNAKGLLEQIKTDIGNLRTAIVTAVDATKTQLGLGISSDIAALGAMFTAAETAVAKVANYLETNASGNTETALLAVTALRTAVGTALDAANTELDAVNAEYAQITTYLGDADAALDKVGTYLEVNSNGNAKGKLEEIKTDIADLKTAIKDALTAANAAIDEVDTEDLTESEATGDTQTNYISSATAPSMKKYLEDGDDKVEAVSVAANAAEQLRLYADTTKGIVDAIESRRRGALEQAGQRVNQGVGYLQEVTSRINHLKTYIDQADGWGAVAKTFITEAEQRVGVAAGIMERISQRVNTALGYAQEAGQRLAGIKSLLEEGGAWDDMAKVFIDETAAHLNEIMAKIQQTGERRQVANSYAEEAKTRMALLTTYINESTGWVDVSKAFITDGQVLLSECDHWLGEAAQRISANQSILGQADRYVSAAERGLLSAQGYRTMGNEKLKEFKEQLMLLDIESRHLERNQSVFVNIWE